MKTSRLHLWDSIDLEVFSLNNCSSSSQVLCFLCIVSSLVALIDLTHSCITANIPQGFQFCPKKATSAIQDQMQASHSIINVHHGDFLKEESKRISKVWIKLLCDYFISTFGDLLMFNG